MVGVLALPCISFLRGASATCLDGEELPIACGARVTFFAGPKKVTKETAWFSPVREKS
jgi:hypothetical protein